MSGNKVASYRDISNAIGTPSSRVPDLCLMYWQWAEPRMHHSHSCSSKPPHIYAE
jgi:hypothetical protein